VVVAAVLGQLDEGSYWTMQRLESFYKHYLTTWREEAGPSFELGAETPRIGC
jgi:hypothetical protein